MIRTFLCWLDIGHSPQRYRGHMVMRCRHCKREAQFRHREYWEKGSGTMPLNGTYFEWKEQGRYSMRDGKEYYG